MFLEFVFIAFNFNRIKKITSLIKDQLKKAWSCTSAIIYYRTKPNPLHHSQRLDQRFSEGNKMKSKHFMSDSTSINMRFLNSCLQSLSATNCRIATLIPITYTIQRPEAHAIVWPIDNNSSPSSLQDFSTQSIQSLKLKLPPLRAL